MGTWVFGIALSITDRLPWLNQHRCRSALGIGFDNIDGTLILFLPFLTPFRVASDGD
jgi:hypothetical protein